MTSIVLADDHAIVRHGIRALLEMEPDFQVIGEAVNGVEAIDCVQRLSPDILVLDLMMPRMSGIEVAHHVKQLAGKTRVVILSMYDTEPYIVEALKAGCSAYVAKTSTSEELVEAICQVLAGQIYVSSALSERALQVYLENAASTVEPYETLTPREREVLHLATEGLTNAEIGVRLSLSARTVEMHRLNLMRKLGLHNQAEMVRYAIQRGILPLQD